MTACRDKIRDVRPGIDVAVVRVPRGLHVHSLRHIIRHLCYIRAGSQSREPAPEELGRLFQQRASFRADLRPVPESSICDLDRRRLEDYFARVRRPDVPADEDEPGWRQLLINTEILTEDSVTLAGMLLFGVAPNRFLPQAGVDATAFPGWRRITRPGNARRFANRWHRRWTGMAVFWKPV